MQPSLPPRQQLAAEGKWPITGERNPQSDPAPWTVRVGGLAARAAAWSLAELAAMPQTERLVDIHCVTRWSKPQTPFRGVLLEDILRLTPPDPSARFVSFIARSERRHSTSLVLAEALQAGALLALEAFGEPLPTSHGGPVRIVTPGRYFYKSLKWLAEIDLLAEDRLGHWESAAGYHNGADPWREERYLAAGVSRQDMQRLMQDNDISGREMRGLEASGRDLQRLNARGAVLRNANFRQAILNGAWFQGANLSNADLTGASLAKASFRDADVEGASFEGANLRGADFQGAALTGATFINPADPQSQPALIDRTTRIGTAELDQMLPDQAAFVARQLS